jgi:2-methylcitrate dehydratase PrpD
LRKTFGGAWNAQTPVRVGTSKVVDVQCGFDYAPSSALNAQMSLRYVVAAALLDGQVLPAQFADAKMTDPALGTLANKLQLVPDPELDKLYPKDFAGWVAAERNGQWERVDILNPTGSVHSPIDAPGITTKFHGINPELPAERIAAVALDIEHHTVGELLGLLHRA